MLLISPPFLCNSIKRHTQCAAASAWGSAAPGPVSLSLTSAVEYTLMSSWSRNDCKRGPAFKCSIPQQWDIYIRPSPTTPPPQQSHCQAGGCHKAHGRANCPGRSRATAEAATVCARSAAWDGGHPTLHPGRFEDLVCATDPTDPYWGTSVICPPPPSHTHTPIKRESSAAQAAFGNARPKESSANGGQCSRYSTPTHKSALVTLPLHLHKMQPSTRIPPPPACRRFEQTAGCHCGTREL